MPWNPWLIMCRTNNMLVLGFTEKWHPHSNFDHGTGCFNSNKYGNCKVKFEILSDLEKKTCRG